MPPTLDPERWRRLEPILDDALDLPPEERGACLDEACGGDEELRRLAGRWLAECESSEDFLEEAGGAYLERVIEASPFDPSALARVGSRLGPFRLVSILGQGGMGTVFLAERADGQFEQQVAIKVAHRQGLGEDARGRFRFERQILARLEHPHIARLLDGGVDEEGSPYLVMERVDGIPLDEYCAAKGLGLTERLRLVADVCRAVSYAHRRQVVHRDLKPSNILVKENGEVKLLDFGVAELLDRPEEVPGPAGSGTSYRLTLGYAAPEILRGETATSSSDLYSLGVLLFQLLTGELPFAAADLSFEELLAKVSEEPPPPPSERLCVPRETGSPTDRELDAVVRETLAEDPAHRPSSAEALAEELRRLVDGEPVQALPQTLPYLLRKKIRRHRRLWLAAGVAALLLIFLAGGWLQSRRLAEQKAEIARGFAQEAERTEWFLRYAQSLPLHDVRRERNLMKARLGRLEEQVAALGDLARGPGNYALGRGYAQLGEQEKALAALEIAWESGFRTAGAALAMGKALGRLYDERLGEVLRIQDADLRAARRREIEERYRDRALEFLRQSGSSELESPSYLSGLIAYYDGRYEEAIQRAALAVEEAPWLPEGHLLEGDAALALASRYAERGEYPPAEARFAQAREAYRRAQEMAPSDPAAYESSCNVWLHVIDLERLRGLDLAESYQRGREACDLALAAQPDRASCLLKTALISLFRLQDSTLGPERVESLLEEARQAGSAARALAPEHAEVYQTLGTTYLTKALLVDMRRGQDPLGDLAAATRAYRRAIELDPGMLTSYSNLGTSLAVTGGLVMARGEDPRPAFDEAIASYQQALDRGPGRVALLNNLGALQKDKGEFQVRRGLDPTEAFRASLATSRKALAVNPRMVPALNLRGALEERLGQVAGDDPIAEEHFERAIHSLQAALDENPTYFRAAVNLGSTRLAWARWRATRGEDPRPLLAEAQENLRHAAEHDLRGDEEVFYNRADALTLEAEIRSLDGRSPRASLRKAAELLRQALEARPESSALYTFLVEGELVRAQLLPEERSPGESCLGEARQEVASLLHRDPLDVPTRLLLARLHGACASWTPAGEARKAAVAASRKLLREVPVDAPLLTRRRALLAAALEVMEAEDGSAGADMARRRLADVIGGDPLARQRWAHLLEEKPLTPGAPAPP